MRSPARRRVVSAGTATLVAGAAVAMLRVLEQTVSKFNPQPSISALIVVIAFFVGLAAARMSARGKAGEAARAREAGLGELAGAWPAPRARQADAIRLGVFPARRDLESVAWEYVPRRIDTALREAMRPGAMVLVLGEPRAGASRTAFEATRAALGDARVLVPRSPGALIELLTLKLGDELDGQPVVVWLDGLSRYREILDANVLAQIYGLTKHVTIVSTVRGDEWDDWLRAGAESGKAGAVAAHARVFELPTLLADDELQAARRLYPQIDLDAGIGAALASNGRERDPPSPRAVVPDDARGSRPIRSLLDDWQLLAPVAGAIGCLIALAIVWHQTGFYTPTASEELAKVEREASKDGRRVQLLASADLHGIGERSTVLLISDSAQGPDRRSDELRIYDEHNDKINLAFSFRPAHPDSVFRSRAVTDIDRDGAQEIIGGYGYGDEAREAIVPFAIDWDSASDQYRMLPLDLGAPLLSRKAATVPEQQYRKIYAELTTFNDPTDKHTLTGHRVQDFAVTPEPHLMIAGWFLTPPLPGHKALFEVHTAIFDTSTGAPHLTPCTLAGTTKPLLLSIGPERLAYHVFNETYTPRDRYCAPNGYE